MKNESNDIYESNGERYVNIKMVSMYTSLPVKTLYEWAATGKIPSIKIGRRVLFDLMDIDRIMNSFKRSSNQCEMTFNKIIGDLHGNGI
ncbi:MAG: helix-turn-helix domain-containing protein [Candidatus Brocadiales bacterium]|nr:helix-turn-helix domain-containing protein [Candidatus Brocadiales bacterium]